MWSEMGARSRDFDFSIGWDEEMPENMVFVSNDKVSLDDLPDYIKGEMYIRRRY